MGSNLKDIFNTIREQSANGNRKALTPVLREIMNNRRDYYRESLDEQLLDEYTDALYKILMLEMDEEEEDSIEMAELAYLGLCTLVLKGDNITPEHYKRRMLLLHYFSDYFTDAVIEIFLKKYKTESLLPARGLAIECLEKMQLSDIFYLEENDPGFLNRDEQLTVACNRIETNPDLSEAELADALLLHKIMYAYLVSKYKN